MENVVLELAKQFPGIAALLLAIFWFVRYIARHDQAYKEIWEDNKAVQRDAIQVIRENTKAAAETGEILKENTRVTVDTGEILREVGDHLRRLSSHSKK